MSEKFPQHDKPSGLSGGSDAWDDDLGGLILSADYFESAPGNQSLSVAFVSNESTFYTTTVIPGSVPISLPFIDNAQEFYGITLVSGSVILLPYVENQNAFYSAHISGGATPQPTVTSGAGKRLVFLPDVRLVGSEELPAKYARRKDEEILWL